MIYLRVTEHDAERTRRKLVSNGLFDKGRATLHSDSYVLFPILTISAARVKKLFPKGSSRVSVVEADGATAKRWRPSFREELGKVLTKDEFNRAVKGYDLLGDIAIIDVPKELSEKERAIAAALLRAHPKVKTVLAKAGGISGVYRRRRFRLAGGERNFTATYKENGCVFRFDVRKSFFSSRLSHERSRVAAMVRGGETVLVLFAGVGPFAIEIAKAQCKSRVVGVELNRDAYTAMKGNILLNGLSNVEAVLGDAHGAARRLGLEADRIVMPMPKGSLRFLDDAFAAAKNRATVHLYAFGDRETAEDDVKREIAKHARRNGYAAEPTFSRVVTEYSPQEVEVVVDYTITKRKRRQAALQSL